MGTRKGGVTTRHSIAYIQPTPDEPQKTRARRSAAHERRGVLQLGRTSGRSRRAAGLRPREVRGSAGPLDRLVLRVLARAARGDLGAAVFVVLLELLPVLAGQPEPVRAERR